jgi:6-pyruvoyltetrahydropterin/6-carboxytetrahydropterin synthase
MAPTLEFTRRYSMAHRLLGDADSKCLTPHGHDEVVTVGMRPLSPMAYGGANAAASFDRAKGRWHAWIDQAVDHAFQLNAADPLIDYFRRAEPARLPRLMVFEGDPTTEALSIAFWRKLSAFLAADGLFEPTLVRIAETPTNSVTLDAEGARRALGSGWSPGAWSDRADDTINDLA